MPIKIGDLKKLVDSIATTLPDNSLVSIYDEYNGAAIVAKDGISTTGIYDALPQEPNATFSLVPNRKN